MTPSLYIESLSGIGAAVLNEHSAKGGTYEL
jgi:hypothetical protein